MQLSHTSNARRRPVRRNEPLHAGAFGSVDQAFLCLETPRVDCRQDDIDAAHQRIQHAVQIRLGRIGEVEGAYLDAARTERLDYRFGYGGWTDGGG